MARLAPILVLAMALCACAEPKTAWRPVTAEELRKRPGFENRTGPRGDFLSATGDFNRDGRPDRVRLMIDDAAKQAGFMVTFGGETRMIPVGAVKVADMHRYGVVVTPPGVYRRACPWVGDVQPRCLGLPLVTLEKDAINIFGFNSTGSYIYWLDGGFRPLGDSAWMDHLK